MPAATDKSATKKWLSPKEAAAVLGVDESTVRRWVTNDRLRYLQFEKGGAILISAEDLFAAQRRSERG